MLAVGKNVGQQACVGNHVPRQGQRHVLVAPETYFFFNKNSQLKMGVVLEAFSVVPEIVFGVDVFEVQNGVFAPLDDLVPQHNLKTHNYNC